MYILFDPLCMVRIARIEHTEFYNGLNTYCVTFIKLPARCVRFKTLSSVLVNFQVQFSKFIHKNSKQLTNGGEMLIMIFHLFGSFMSLIWTVQPDNALGLHSRVLCGDKLLCYRFHGFIPICITHSAISDIYCKCLCTGADLCTGATLNS